MWLWFSCVNLCKMVFHSLLNKKQIAFQLMGVFFKMLKVKPKFRLPSWIYSDKKICFVKLCLHSLLQITIQTESLILQLRLHFPYQFDYYFFIWINNLKQCNTGHEPFYLLFDCSAIFKGFSMYFPFFCAELLFDCSMIVSCEVSKTKLHPESRKSTLPQNPDCSLCVFLHLPPAAEHSSKILSIFLVCDPCAVLGWGVFISVGLHTEWILAHLEVASRSL